MAGFGSKAKKVRGHLSIFLYQLINQKRQNNRRTNWPGRKCSMSDKKKKILIADDDPAILEALTLMLEDADYEVETTVNGETIYKMEKEYPDLLVLDIWMSGMDGRDICKHLKKQELTKDIPIIIMSANKDTKQMAKESGADDFITKPFEMKDLLAKVAQYIKGSK